MRKDNVSPFPPPKRACPSFLSVHSKVLVQPLHIRKAESVERATHLHFFSPTTLLPPICTCQDQDQVKTRTPRTAAMHASRIANNESPAQTTNQPLRLQSLLLSITASQVHSYPRKPATRFGIEATIVPLALVPLRGLLHPTQLYFVLCTARTVSETHSTSQLHTTHDA